MALTHEEALEEMRRKNGPRNIYRVKLSAKPNLLWAIVHGVASSKEEASKRAIQLFIDEHPDVIVEKCSNLEECKFE